MNNKMIHSPNSTHNFAKHKSATEVALDDTKNCSFTINKNINARNKLIYHLLLQVKFRATLESSVCIREINMITNASGSRTNE
jgi:hypothetical protein